MLPSWAISAGFAGRMLNEVSSLISLFTAIRKACLPQTYGGGITNPVTKSPRPAGDTLSWAGGVWNTTEPLGLIIDVVF